MRTQMKSYKGVKVEASGSLGRRLVIPAGTVISPGPSKVEYNTPIYEVLIGIGRNNTASLYLDEDALQALRAGEEINI